MSTTPLQITDAAKDCVTKCGHALQRIKGIKVEGHFEENDPCDIALAREIQLLLNSEREKWKREKEQETKMVAHYRGLLYGCSTHGLWEGLSCIGCIEQERDEARREVENWKKRFEYSSIECSFAVEKRDQLTTENQQLKARVVAVEKSACEAYKSLQALHEIIVSGSYNNDDALRLIKEGLCPKN